AAGTNIKARRLEQLTPEAFDDLIALNLTGAFNLINALLEPLRAARGDVVLIGSVSGAWPDRSGATYQASKAALHAFARGAAFDERHGVRFTSIMPGLVDTAILDNRPEPPTAELRAQMLAPEDVAAACLFVVSLPHRPHVPTMAWFAIPLMTLGARFSERGIALGVALSIGLLLAVGFGVDAQAVIDEPTLVIAPIALMIAVALFQTVLMRSDVKHRAEA